MIGGHADAPDAVERGRFDQDFGAGVEQKLFEFGVLAEFGQVGPAHNVKAVLIPGVFIEALDLAAEIFGRTGRFGLADFFDHGLIAEQPGFFGHHVMLSSGVVGPLDGEGGRVPLAEATFADGAIGGLPMTPEKHVLQPFALVDAFNQLFVVADLHVKTPMRLFDQSVVVVHALPSKCIL